MTNYCLFFCNWKSRVIAVKQIYQKLINNSNINENYSEKIYSTVYIPTSLQKTCTFINIMSSIVQMIVVGEIF